MIGIYRATWIALRRPAVLVGLYLATAAMTALITTLNFAFCRETAVDVPDNGVGRSLRALSGPAGPTAGLSVSTFGFSILICCLAAATFAGQYSTGTLRTLLVRQPHRVRMLTGVWAALVAFGVGAVAISAVVSLAISPWAAGRYGVPTEAWATADGVGTTLRAIVEAAFSAAGFVTFGAALGVVLRAPVPAVAIAFGWLLMVESILPQAARGAYHWLPGYLLNVVAAHGTHAVSFGTALGTVSLYLVGAAAVAVGSFVRRDVVC